MSVYVSRNVLNNFQTKSFPLKYVLLLIADFCDENGYAFPSQTTMVRYSCMSMSCLKRSIYKLKALGEIRVVTTGVGKSMKSFYYLDKYKITPEQKESRSAKRTRNGSSQTPYNGKPMVADSSDMVADRHYPIVAVGHTNHQCIHKEPIRISAEDQFQIDLEKSRKADCGIERDLAESVYEFAETYGKTPLFIYTNVMHCIRGRYKEIPDDFLATAKEIESFIDQTF